MNTETDTTKVYYVVTWKAISLEFCFLSNTQYLDASVVAEGTIASLLREYGKTIPILRVHIASLLDDLARTLVDIVKPMGVNVDGIPCYKIPALTQEDLTPVWGEQRGENYQRWFSYYHMLKKLKFVGDHCGEEQIFYTEPEPEPVVEEEEEEPVQKKKNQKIGMCAVCVTETHRRCACREIYYCSAVCSKSDWKAHKKTCCYDGR